MPKFYNKATAIAVKKTTMTESELLLYKKSEGTCTPCPIPLKVGVEQKHDSYERYLIHLRKNL